MSVIAFFIIVACAVRSRGSPAGSAGADAARAAVWPYAYLLFAAGLFNASLFRRLHPAAFDGLFGVRRLGLSPASTIGFEKLRSSTGCSRADRGGRRSGHVAAIPACEDDPVLTGDQRSTAPLVLIFMER
jgi:hypothetical protein